MDHLSNKLSAFVDLSETDRQVLSDAAQSCQTHLAGVDLIREGERPDAVYLVIDGWAYRYKILRGGERQILAFLLPGDICDMHIFILKKMDHCIATLSPATVCSISQDRMLDIIDNHRAINRSMWWSTLVDQAIQREWLANIGQRDAFERVAHLLCELGIRLNLVGLMPKGRAVLPLTQRDIADAVGLTPIHVNRVLQRLRKEGHIDIAKNEIYFHDFESLARMCDFEPNYLHLDRRRNGAE